MTGIGKGGVKRVSEVRDQYASRAMTTGEGGRRRQLTKPRPRVASVTGDLKAGRGVLTNARRVTKILTNAYDLQ